MQWTVAIVDETCGACGALLPPDQPIALYTTLRKIRCVSCAEKLGHPLNPHEIDLERFRVEKDRLDSTITRAMGAPAPFIRHQLRRPMKSSAEMAEELRHVFDPKAAASGDQNRDR